MPSCARQCSNTLREKAPAPESSQCNGVRRTKEMYCLCFTDCSSMQHPRSQRAGNQASTLSILPPLSPSPGISAGPPPFPEEAGLAGLSLREQNCFLQTRLRPQELSHPAFVTGADGSSSCQMEMSSRKQDNQIPNCSGACHSRASRHLADTVS